MILIFDMIPNSFRIFTRLLIHKGLEYFNKYYGVYYGFVLQNQDPKNLGRLYVYIPEVNGIVEKGIWAYPMGQYGGINYGMNLTPKINDRVFIQYRFGNPQFPLWTYAGYQIVETDTEKESGKPAEFDTVDTYGIKFPNGITIKINDVEDEGKILVFHPSNHWIEISKDQISIIYNGTERIKVLEDEITFNDGSNGGLVKIDAILEKINTLENLMNTHVHPVSGANTGPVSPVPIPALTNKSDIEDTQVNH